jgi:hypothetical protein
VRESPRGITRTAHEPPVFEALAAGAGADAAGRVAATTVGFGAFAAVFPVVVLGFAVDFFVVDAGTARVMGVDTLGLADRARADAEDFAGVTAVAPFDAVVPDVAAWTPVVTSPGRVRAEISDAAASRVAERRERTRRGVAAVPGVAMASIVCASSELSKRLPVFSAENESFGPRPSSHARS